MEAAAAGILEIERAGDRIAERMLGQFFSVHQAVLELGNDVVVAVHIVAGLLELEVDEFEEGAEVFGSGAAVEFFGVFIDAGSDGSLFAGEFLFKFGGGEVAQAGGGNDGI